MQLKHPPRDDVAVDVMTRIQRLLDVERAAIGGLSGVRLGGTPLISGDQVSITLTLGTSQDVPFVEKLRLAIDAIDHVRARLAEFPEIQSVEDEEAPPIATVR